MALTTIVSIYSNYDGGGLDASKASVLVLTTVANQPSYEVLVASDTATQVILKYYLLITQAEQDAIAATNTENLADHVILMAGRSDWIFIPDLVTCFIFLIFLIYWKRKSS